MRRIIVIILQSESFYFNIKRFYTKKAVICKDELYTSLFFYFDKV
jgi:hypothetical protein